MSLIDLGPGQQPVRSIEGEWHDDIRMFCITVVAGRRRRRTVQLLMVKDDVDRLFRQLYPHADLPAVPATGERERVVILGKSQQDQAPKPTT